MNHGLSSLAGGASINREREPKPTVYEDAGVELLGMLPEGQRDLLRSVWEAARRSMESALATSAARGEIFWVNLWQRSGGGERMAVEGIDTLEDFARSLAARSYEGDDAEVDGFGFMINPVGARAQSWHVDYTMDYSELFIPLTRLTPENCMQYLVLPPSVPTEVRERIAADLDVIDLDALVVGCDYVSLRQLLARPFTIIKLGFGTIHRGVGNLGDFERVTFFIAMKKRGALLPAEPLVEIAHR